MQLFAIVRGTGTPVHRIQLKQGIQQQVHDYFRNQATVFLQMAEDLISFQASYSADSDELFYIDNFQDPYDLMGKAHSPIGCPIFAISDDMIDRIVGLYVVATVNNVETVCLQSFDRRRALTQGRFTLIDVGEGFGRLEQTGLTLDASVTVVILGSRLIFKSYHQASRFFDLTSHFHEATTEEVESFAQHEKILAPPSELFLKLASTSRIRKQIALIVESGILESVSARTIAKKAATFKLTVATSTVNGKLKLVLPDNRPALKNMLDFLLENFYKGCLTDKTFVSNSKRSAEQ